MKTKFLIAAYLVLVSSAPALAYIGPGAGMGAIGTVIAVIGAILLMIVGFVWYPVKRLLKGRRPEPEEDDVQDETSN